MKDYDKNKESSCLKHWDVNYLNGWVMSQKLPVNGSQWVEDISEFDENFIKSYKQENDGGYRVFLNLIFNILKNYMIFGIIYHFYLKEWKLKKSKRL